MAATFRPHHAWCRRHDRGRCRGRLRDRRAGVWESTRRADRRGPRGSRPFEPLAYSAQNLYAALSAADSAAASAFLSGRIETAANQARYRQALADAASAGGRDRGGPRCGDPHRDGGFGATVRVRGWSSLRGPTTGRGSRSGPRTCGVSSLMQTALLPGAGESSRAILPRSTTTSAPSGSTPVLSLVLLVLVLAAIGVGSVIVPARTGCSTLGSSWRLLRCCW